MAAGIEYSCSVLIPATGVWREKTLLYKTEVTLSQSELAYTFDTPDGWLERRIMLEDLIGIRVHAKSDSTEAPCAVDIHSLPLISTTSWFSGKETQSRKHKIDQILFGSEKTFQQNVKLALGWKRTVMQYCEKAVKGLFVHADGSTCSLHKSPEKHPNLLVLINPVAGKGKSVALFRSQVQPLFELADIDLEILVTDEQGHARKFVKTCNISQFDGIVVVSGDGLINEVVTGLMEREDWEKAIKTPIGHIPTGSGNVLCSSLFYQNKEEDMSLASAALQIIRGGVEAVDLATVHTADGNTTYMLLLANWGILADIDIESESLRCLGGLVRDYLGAIKCIVQGRTYPGRLHYLPVDVTGSPEEVLKQEESPVETRKSADHHGSDASSRHLSTNLLPTLSTPLPETWKTIDGVFTLVCPLMAPMVTEDFIGHPDVHLGSGEITIPYIFDDATRWDLLSIMLDTSSGNWIKHHKVHVVKAKAYRIEPLCDSGTMTVDGEVVALGATQAQVHRHAVRVFSRKHLINT